jgi:hypothetical protein
LFIASVIVLAQPMPAVNDHLPWRLTRLLAENVNDYDCVVIEAIDDPPCRAFVHDASFMATSTDPRNRSRMRRTELGAALQLPQQYATSTRAACENGGALTSPRSHTSGLSMAATYVIYVKLDIHVSGEACLLLSLSGLQLEQQISQPEW